MPTTDPMISNASTTRFLFGTFDCDGGKPLFHGTVVFGSDLTYDADTGLPTGGEVSRVERQTRSETEVLQVHAVCKNVAGSVADLNTQFAGADDRWFDFAPSIGRGGVAGNAPTSSAAPAKKKVAGNPRRDNHDTLTAAARNFQIGTGNLYLETGDVLTAKELRHIFSAAGGQIGPGVGDDDADAMSVLHALLKEISGDVARPCDMPRANPAMMSATH